MTWELLIMLIAKVGVPLALKLEEKWSKKNEPVTAEEMAELNLLAEQDAKSQLIDSLKRNGVALDSPQALSLLAMLPKQ